MKPNRRVQDDDQEPQHEVNVPRKIKPGLGDEVPKKSSSLANPRRLGTVENAIRTLMLPELGALRQEQRAKRDDQLPERSHQDFKDSPITRGDMSHTASKHANIPDTSEDLKALPRRNGNGADTHERTDHTFHKIRSHRSPGIMRTKTRRPSHDKTREKTLIHASDRSQISLLIKAVNDRTYSQGPAFE